MTVKPLLTIAIPTWNRSIFLAKTLAQLNVEIGKDISDSVEILISDNASTDETRVVVAHATQTGLNINYIRNSENLGSDANIAQCFNLASGKYLLILGDDDLFIDNSLRTVLNRLKQKEYGVVCMRPYGFETDFRKEYPGDFGNEQEFDNVTDFLTSISVLITLISSCIINRDLIGNINANDFCGSNLVQVHLVIRAAIKAEHNFFINKYIIACQRNNSGGYDFSTIFVNNLFSILDGYKSLGLGVETILKVENRLLLSYYPFYIFRLRLAKMENRSLCYQNFNDRFHDRILFKFWISPIITLPRPLALVWGGLTIIIGRSLNGEFRRGFVFFYNRFIFSKLANRPSK